MNIECSCGSPSISSIYQTVDCIYIGLVIVRSEINLVFFISVKRYSNFALPDFINLAKNGCFTSKVGT
jgi:hypothetical protein